MNQTTRCVGQWPFASFRVGAAVRSLLERSGHQLEGKIGRFGRERPIPDITPAYWQFNLAHADVIRIHLNRVQSSRRLEREAGRNVEVMWLLGRLALRHVLAE